MESKQNEDKKRGALRTETGEKAREKERVGLTQWKQNLHKIALLSILTTVR